MNTTSQFLIAAYVLGLGLVVAQVISMWVQLSTTKDTTDDDGGRP